MIGFGRNYAEFTERPNGQAVRLRMCFIRSIEPSKIANFAASCKS